VVTILNQDEWLKGLTDHPDKDFVKNLIEYIDFGVPLLFEGPVLNQTFPNWKSCDNLRSEVKSSMSYDISRRWKIGPFASQPFDSFVGSPMGAFSKPSPTSNILKTLFLNTSDPLSSMAHDNLHVP
jgi:hypothetical protein